MLKDNELIGTIGIYRQEVRPFTNKQIELVPNLPRKPSSRSRMRGCSMILNKLDQQLEQHVDDQVNEIERMSRLRRFLPSQVADLIVASGTERSSKATAGRLPRYSAICAVLQASLKALIQRT